ncbi:hypothetical protein DFH06DRAFT_1132046 [Mycena polygramma]|nr:hypothetical protein DFH06DRAFT_1132046 [Mycena polygramma]
MEGNHTIQTIRSRPIFVVEGHREVPELETTEVELKVSPPTCVGRAGGARQERAPERRCVCAQGIERDGNRAPIGFGPGERVEKWDQIVDHLKINAFKFGEHNRIFGVYFTVRLFCEHAVELNVEDVVMVFQELGECNGIDRDSNIKASYCRKGPRLMVVIIDESERLSRHCGMNDTEGEKFGPVAPMPDEEGKSENVAECCMSCIISPTSTRDNHVIGALSIWWSCSAEGETDSKGTPEMGVSEDEVPTPTHGGCGEETIALELLEHDFPQFHWQMERELFVSAMLEKAPHREN